VWVDLNVNADDRFGEMPSGIEAVVTKIDAQLIFTLGMETAVAFVTSGIIGLLDLTAGVTRGMDFGRNHSNSPNTQGQAVCQKRDA